MLIYLFSFYFGVLTLPRVSSFSRQMTCKSMKLFHRSFLLHLAVRLGHEAFIAHFIAPLIEAAGGDRDLTPPPVEATNVARSEGGVVFCFLCAVEVGNDDFALFFDYGMMICFGLHGGA